MEIHVRSHESSPVVLSSDEDWEYKPQSTSSRSSSRRGSNHSQDSKKSTQVISQSQTQIIPDSCDLKPQKAEVASRPRGSRSRTQKSSTQSSIKSFFQK